MPSVSLLLFDTLEPSPLCFVSCSDSFFSGFLDCSPFGFGSWWFCITSGPETKDRASAWDNLSPVSSCSIPKFLLSVLWDGPSVQPVLVVSSVDMAIIPLCFLSSSKSSGRHHLHIFKDRREHFDAALSVEMTYSVQQERVKHHQLHHQKWGHQHWVILAKSICPMITWGFLGFGDISLLSWDFSVLPSKFVLSWLDSSKIGVPEDAFLTIFLSVFITWSFISASDCVLTDHFIGVLGLIPRFSGE